MEPTIQSFPLTVTLTRPELVEWLAAVPPDQLEHEVERALAAGRMVLTLMQAGTSDEAMSRFFSPVLNNMDTLNETITRLLGATQKSQRLGEIGETTVAEQLKRAFPGDDFEITAKAGHVGDVRARVDLGAGRRGEAIVEVKLYTNDVPTPELEKFRRDLETTGVRYGLMVSLTSRMMGISGPVHVEEGPGYVAVYVPDSGLDGFGVLWGMGLLKAIMQYHARSEAARLIATGAIDQAWARLRAEVQTLGDLQGDLRRARADVGKARDTVMATLDTVSTATLSIELRLQAALERIQARLAEELAALPQTGVPANLLAAAAPEAVLAALAGLKGDKRAPTLEALYDLAKELGLEVALADDPAAWRLLRDGTEVAATKPSKNRVDLLVPLAPDRPVTVLPGIDELKGTEVTVKGDKLDRFIDRARAWLAA